MKWLIRPLVAWVGLFVLAFVNGALRELILKNGLGIVEPTAHQLSCLTGIVLWTGFVWLIWNRIKISTMKQAVLTGLIWFILTFLFETFVLNRHLSWPEILHTYDAIAGEFWGLVLLWLGLMPVAIFFLKKPKA